MRAYQNRFRLDRFGYMFLYLQLLAGGKIPTYASENAATSICMSSWMLETRVEGYGCEGDIQSTALVTFGVRCEGDLSTRGGDLRVLFQPTCAGDFGS